VRHLVELHGGSIEAHSPGPGQGATFIVTLPVMIVHSTGKLAVKGPETATQNKGEKSPFDCPPALQGLRLLVVDDVIDALDLVTSILRLCQAEVKAVASAAEAFEVYRDWQPDILISDIEMPDEDGYSLIRRIRETHWGKGRQIPAIALTAHARVEDRVKALEAGYQSHVTKPVDPDELVAVIASLTRNFKPG
jgi:CheY-like chemotaxis protein